ncbi:MAG: threonine--tRNA ligase, partial [Candidatus Blackburnbacteria bacterium]|nr:threonine--tRNA ligase [Candidatus Blackburnbacteria bacterium]
MTKKQNNSNLEAMRHSAEHVLTFAMLKTYPGLLPAMGPATDDGFYFDFDFEGKIQEKDFARIEKKMQEIVLNDYPITHQELSIRQARKLFAGNPYKLEWLDEIEKRGENAS